MMSGLFALAAAPAFGQVAKPQGGVAGPAGGRKPETQAVSTLAAAMIACWSEGFGGLDRLRMTVRGDQTLRVWADGRSGEGFILVRGFLAAGAALESVTTVAVAGTQGNTIRWSSMDRLPELATFTLNAPLLDKPASEAQMQLMAGIMGRPDPRGAFDADRKLTDEMEAAVTSVMGADSVTATWIKPPDRSEFGDAMRVLSGHAPLAQHLGEPSLWSGNPMAVVWPLSRGAKPQRIAMVGMRVQASILQACRVGAALDPLVLPPEDAEKAAAASPEVARALATVSRLGNCQAAEPVVIARVGVLSQARPRPVPPFLKIVGLGGAAEGASS